MIQDPYKEIEGTEVVIVAKVHTKEEEGGSKVAAKTIFMAAGTNLMEAGADQDTMEPQTPGGGVMAHRSSNINQITKRIEISWQALSHAIDVAQKVT
jgi:hypothetical protein